ncbi:MAG TPA: type II secretion system F family protein [Candidatus Merdenecus merdavium]|nr:type II secretion system F family protein [Candidatus Merdenecus merdavium]
MVYYVTLGILLAILVLSVGYQGAKDVKSYFDKIGVYLFDKISLKAPSFNWETKKQKLSMLYPMKEAQKSLKEYYCRKLKLTYALILAGTILALIFHINPMVKGLIVDNSYIKRGEYGTGEEEVELKVQIEEETLSSPIVVEVEERNYTDQEIESMFQESEEILPTIILGDNPSLDEVRENINLVKKIPNTPIQVEWMMESEDLIDYDGSINQEKATQEGEVVKLSAMLSYEKQQKIYEFYICVYAQTMSEEEQMVKEIQDEIATINHHTKEEEHFYLPEKVGDKKLVWIEESQDMSKISFLFLCFLGIVLFFAKDRELVEQLEIRDHQLLLDYPDIVSKLSLLIHAGMTITGSIEKIVQDSKKSKTDKLRYAYAELEVTLYDLERGVSKKEAFERLGFRCGNSKYIKLCSLLSQNMQKGNKGLVKQLEEEAFLAFEERKNVAKKLGEEASTKMLLPMMLLLLVVLIILVVPAFLSMNI